MNDSNVDWNQALPSVQHFVQQHDLQQLELDPYGFNDPNVFVPRAEFWDCQRPAARDAGQWVVVSANMIMESHNCLWLMQYPHESLAGGGMYAVRLPERIPPPGTSGGPPAPADCRNFLGAPVDTRFYFIDLVRNPQKLPEAVAYMEAAYRAARKGQTISPPNANAK